jgi:hypothetical protein
VVSSSKTHRAAICSIDQTIPLTTEAGDSLGV